MLTRRSLAVLGELGAIEALTGERPDGCPWAVFHDPQVQQVLRAYDYFERHQAAEYWGRNPPWWLVEGVRYYDAALRRVRADAREQARKQRAARGRRAELPAGAVVEHEITD